MALSFRTQADEMFLSVWQTFHDFSVFVTTKDQLKESFVRYLGLEDLLVRDGWPRSQPLSLSHKVAEIGLSPNQFTAGSGISLVKHAFYPIHQPAGDVITTGYSLHAWASHGRKEFLSLSIVVHFRCTWVLTKHFAPFVKLLLQVLVLQDQIQRINVMTHPT